MTYEEWLAHKSTEFDESKVKRDSRGRFAEKASSEKVRIKTEDGREIEGEYVSLDNAKRMKLYQGPNGTYTTDINRGVVLSQRTGISGLQGPADARTTVEKAISKLKSSGKKTLDSIQDYARAGKDWLKNKLVRTETTIGAGFPDWFDEKSRIRR